MTLIVSFVKFMHVIQEVIGSQLLILVAGKEHLQYKCPIETHCFKLEEDKKEDTIMWQMVKIRSQGVPDIIK